MEALYLLIPLSVIIVALAVWVFFGEGNRPGHDQTVQAGDEPHPEHCF